MTSMYLSTLSAGQLTKAYEAADYLLRLPARLDPELAIKLDTLRADLTAELEDREPSDLSARQTSPADRAATP
jgi:hypothetical protein